MTADAFVASIGWEILAMMDSWARYNISVIQPAETPLYLMQYPCYIGQGLDSHDYAVGVYKEWIDFLIEDTTNAYKAKYPSIFDFGFHFGAKLKSMYEKFQHSGFVFLLGVYRHLHEEVLNKLCFDPQKKLFDFPFPFQRRDVVIYVKFEVDASKATLGQGYVRYQNDMTLYLNEKGDRRVNSNEVQGDFVDFDRQCVYDDSLKQNLSQHAMSLAGSRLSPNLAACGQEDEWCLVPMATNADPYFIVPEGEPKPGSNVGWVPKSHPLWNFLLWMPLPRIKLEHPHISGQKTPLATDDEMQRWFRVMFGIRIDSPLAQVSFIAPNWPLQTVDHPIGLEFTVEIPSGTGSGQKHVLSFDTEGAAKLLGTTPAALGQMLSTERFLAFAVSFQDNQFDNNSWTLSEVAELIDFELTPTVKAILGATTLEPRPNDIGAHTARSTLPSLSMPSGNGPAAGGRNALWYRGGLNHYTDLRLEFTVSNKDVLMDWLSRANLRINVTDIGVIAKKHTNASYRVESTPGPAVPRGNGGELTIVLGVTLDNLPFDVYIQFRGKAGITMRFQTRQEADESESVLQKMYTWLSRTLGIQESDLQADSWLHTARENKFLSGVKPRAFELSLSLDAKGYPTTIDSVQLALQIELPVSDNESLFFFATFGWSRQEPAFLLAELWCGPSAAGRSSVDYARAMPEWEAYLSLEPHPSAGKKALDRVDLKKLLKISGLPAGVPNEVDQASLKINATGVVFSTALVCTPPKKDEGVPRLAIDRLELSADFRWPSKEKKAAFSAQLKVDMMLFPDGKTVNDGVDLRMRDDGARIIGALEYDSNTSAWKLQAGVDNLTMSHLAGFLDMDSRDGALAMLEHLNIGYLRLSYSYLPGDGAGGSEFIFVGGISLGQLKLAVDFSRKSGEQGSWTFEITAGLDDSYANDGQTTVRSLLASLFGSEDAIPATVPGVVLDIQIGRPSKPEEILSIKCSTVTVKGKEKEEENKMLVMMGSLHLGNISLSLMQVRNIKWNKNVPSKRIVKVAVGKIGPLKAPLVGDIDLPIEQMMYLWVSAAEDTSGGSGKGSFDTADDKVQGQKLGITMAEYLALSQKIDHSEDQLFFKSAKDDPVKIGQQETVIEAGSHFMVVAKNGKGVSAAVLDYVFGRPKPKTRVPPKLLVSSGTGEESDFEEFEDDEYDFEIVAVAGDNETANPDVSKAPFKKSVGPLEVENIGLQYDKDTQRLGIVLDATFLLGPIGLALLGFGLSVSLKKPEGKLKLTCPGPYSSALLPMSRDDKLLSQEMLGLPLYAPEVSLAGLFVSFDKPPLTVAGGLMHAKLPNEKGEFYAGGIIVSFKPWMFKAIGLYSEVNKDGSISATVDDKEKFTSVFVIFKLEGPLFSVGFADISGITGGLGVNSVVRLPTAETVLKFPFVDPSGVNEGDPPLKTLRALLSPKNNEEPWFSAREGSFWAAAGLKATAFQMLDVDAVVVIQLNPDVQLGIYGVAVCDVPSFRSTVKFAHAELGVACTLDIGSGTFKFEAQLSPRSYVLDKSCHLRGGIALFAWFKGTNKTQRHGLDGDWVLTIGGYHAAFSKPSHYPAPPRLGISWTLEGVSISITGEAYFAITPRVCMGGGRLHAALSAGALSAWFDAALDFLINHDPFFFAAVGSLSVGVEFTLDLWLVTLHISAEIGASLTVAGPPIAGIVHVDFWVFGFDIHFGGNMPNRPGQSSLGEFVKLALKAGGSNAVQGLNLLEAGGGLLVGDDEYNDWVTVEDDKNDDTTKPFLFNCNDGLTPADTKGGGKKSLAHLACLDEKEQEKVWMVKGGVFSFSITLGFAASAGRLYDKRLNATPRPNNDPQPMPVPKELQESVFALPMGLTKHIESTVTVTVQEKDAISLRRFADEDKDDDWKITPIIKSVPYSVWGKCKCFSLCLSLPLSSFLRTYVFRQKLTKMIVTDDPAQDPALHGNGVSELLNGDKNGSIPLVMGFTLSPPPAHLSLPQRPKFNLVEDTVQTVATSKFKHKHEALGAWAPRDLLVAPPVPGKPDNDKDEQERKKKAWEEVPRRWQDPQNRPDDAVQLWAARLRLPDKALTGKPPARLLHRFERMVPALPMIAVGLA